MLEEYLSKLTKGFGLKALETGKYRRDNGWVYYPKSVLGGLPFSYIIRRTFGLSKNLSLEDAMKLLTRQDREFQESKYPILSHSHSPEKRIARNDVLY